MIEYIKGQLTELTPTYSVIECSGVGYLLNISVPTYSALEGKTDAKLLVHEAIREDAHVLYGFIFSTKKCSSLFLPRIARQLPFLTLSLYSFN